MGVNHALTPQSIADLRPAITGRVIGPDDPGYDERRSVFYGGFDRRPAVIVRAADASDVARVVSLAGRSVQSRPGMGR